jgi:hypothetical protein
MIRCAKITSKKGRNMYSTIKDSSHGHGTQFTLALRADSQRAREAFLRVVRLYFGEVLKEKSVLYIYGLRHIGNEVELDFAYGSKHMAMVDYRWNFRREDQKFAVVVVESDKENIGNEIVHYDCYLCKNETWGVNRVRMEVYDNKTKSIVEVNVHDACKLEYFRKNSTAR